MRVIISLFLLGLLGCAPAANVTDEKKQQAEVHYKMAISHLQANNPTLALQKLLPAVELDPDNSAIQVALAQTYQQKHSYENAERHYLKALKLSNNDPKYLNNLATLYLDMQQWDKAIENFDKAIADLLFLSPHVALAGKGFALFQKKEYPAALEQYDAALAIAPSYAAAYYLKSQVYSQMQEQKQERQALERAVSLYPEYPQANYQLAILLLKEDETKAAAQLLKQVIGVVPDSELGLKSAEILKGLQGKY